MYAVLPLDIVLMTTLGKVLPAGRRQSPVAGNGTTDAQEPVLPVKSPTLKRSRDRAEQRKRLKERRTEMERKGAADDITDNEDRDQIADALIEQAKAQSRATELEGLKVLLSCFTPGTTQHTEVIAKITSMFMTEKTKKKKRLF
jgi:hypothetical protein